MKTIIAPITICLLCGCYGNTTPGQYKTRERPSAVVEPGEPGKEAKAADKGKAAEKNLNIEKNKGPEIGKGPEKTESSEKNQPADKK